MVDALPPPPPPRSEDRALQYTHSGARYLLGYGERFFGIWDRGEPSAPVERFARTDDGWREAWRRFSALEPHPAEVGLGTGPPVAQPAPAAPAPAADPAGRTAVGRADHPAWWLLPILMGWMGGVLAWLLIRDRDPGRARAMLVAGIVATVVWFVLYSAMLPTPTP